jgi:prevent-host-death family protein
MEGNMGNLWRVSATEVKNSWGRVVRRVLQHREPALVESKGVATVVILPADEYERLVAERTAESHKQQQLILLDEAERFAKEVAARYPDYPSPDSVEILREMREERDGELTGLH